MNWLRSRWLLFLVALLVTTLACRFTVELPWNVSAPDLEISPEDVAGAATRVAVAAATAAAFADQAGQLAATAVLEGDNAVSTAVAGEGLPAVGAGVALQEKLNNIRPDANGNFTVTFTDADMRQLVEAQGSSFSSEEAQLENLQVRFTPQHVVATGDLVRPLEVPLTVQLRPFISNGRLRFEVIEATAGMFPVPASLLSTLEIGVNAALGQAFNGMPAGATLVDVALGVGSMTVLGRMN